MSISLEVYEGFGEDKKTCSVLGFRREMGFISEPYTHGQEFLRNLLN